MPTSSIGMFHFLQPLLPWYDISKLRNLLVDMIINFILAQFEQKSKKMRGPVFSIFFMERKESVRRQSTCSLQALWVTHFLQEFSYIYFQVWPFIHIITNNRIRRNKFEMMACFYPENLNTKEPMWTAKIRVPNL